MDLNGENGKLDWMYKGANSLVNREEYLLGKNIDKPLEQLNREEKEKKLGIVPPKNHVEHECIPPSIRDFNKIVQAEQVDLSAKLQEDPLVAIKRQEEEARRQFLQNPVQLKKLQEALKAQEKQRKMKKRKRSKNSDSESDLDEQLKQKLMKLGNPTGDVSKTQKKKKAKHLDTILMHKFNKLKEKLSQKDLDDILDGKISDSDDEPPKKIKKKRARKDSSDDSEQKIEKDRKYKQKSRERGIKDYKNKSKNTEKQDKTKKRRYSSSSDSQEKDTKYSEINYSHTKEKTRAKNQSDDFLDRMILQKLRSLRDSQPLKDTEEPKEKIMEGNYSYYDSDEDKVVHKKKAFGLVRPDGTKIQLNKTPQESAVKPTKKEEIKKPQIQKPKKLTEAEKEERRKQMMSDAVERDAERSENLKRYRQQESKQEVQKDFDKDFVHKQLAKTANEASVESRLKSNLNNLQRSSQHMNLNFSRR